jgi:phosphate:Na+ symporter
MDYVAIQKMIFSLVGGLGIFLLGMRHMSDGLQTVSGPSLRRLIASVTGNRLMAAAVGVVVTCIVQSSSVSTVMTIGLVNSGIMTLTQALGVIVGANIGTTVTGWILVLKVGAWGLPILGVAAFVFLFSKNEKRRYLALAIMGVGMVFFGLEIMKGGVKVIRSIPEFEQAFTYFAATSYLGVLKCALAGCLLTILVQSSSATLAITIALASQGVINFESAAALVLGENIGTTITAYLASLGASANARRAAYFHVLFNVVGVFVITLLFQAYLPFVKWIVSTAFGVENVSAAIIEDGATVYPYAVTGIAVTHSVFNIVNTCAFLPFLPFIAGLLERLVSEKTEVRQKLLTHLDYHHFETPVAALEMSGREIDKMAKYSRESFDDLIAYADADEERGSEVAERVFSQEANLDVAQGEVTEFLANLMGEAISHEDVEISKNQLRLADERLHRRDLEASLADARQRFEFSTGTARRDSRASRRGWRVLRPGECLHRQRCAHRRHGSVRSGERPDYGTDPHVAQRTLGANRRRESRSDGRDDIQRRLAVLPQGQGPPAEHCRGARRVEVGRAANEDPDRESDRLTP